MRLSGFSVAFEIMAKALMYIHARACSLADRQLIITVCACDFCSASLHAQWNINRNRSFACQAQLVLIIIAVQRAFWLSASACKLMYHIRC